MKHADDKKMEESLFQQPKSTMLFLLILVHLDGHQFANEEPKEITLILWPLRNEPTEL